MIGIALGKPSTISSTYLLDDIPFTKVFTKAGLRLHVNTLTPNAKSVYLWIMYELDPNVDYLEINKKRYVQE